MQGCKIYQNIKGERSNIFDQGKMLKKQRYNEELLCYLAFKSCSLDVRKNVCLVWPNKCHIVMMSIVYS